MVRKIIVLTAVMIFTAAYVYAAPADLPETGQTKCYRDVSPYDAILCAGTGQDGELTKGVAWPVPRFTDNSNGTVTDNLTGLIWLRAANCFGLKTWTQALTDANTLANGQCGLTDGSQAGDWRLPNVSELESMISSGEANSATWLNTLGFSNVQAYYYWSSTTYAYNTSYAWVVGMWFGSVYYSNKTDSSYVWPVRSGQ